MATGTTPTNRRARKRGRRDVGRIFAMTLCVLFALVGLVPLALGLLVRASPIRAIAARKTAEIIHRELGIAARYHVSVQAWPMALDLEDVVVDADDGGSPALSVERISVRPRLFSLLDGRVDVGEVEVLGPRVRAVVEDGELKNLALRLPETSPSAEPMRAPFSALAVTDGHFDVLVDGVHVVTNEVDVDVSAEDDGAYEIALRAGQTSIVRTHPVPGLASEDMVDEDMLCRLDARVRLDEDGVLVRRLTLVGAADLDPDPGTSPGCDLPREDWRTVELGLGALRVELPKGSAPLTIPKLHGRVRTRLPIPLAHRFAPTPWLTGAVGLDVELEYDGQSSLPRVAGRIEADKPGLSGKVFATTLAGDLAISEDVVRVSKIEVGWADGEATIADVKIQPFAPGAPLSAGPIEIRNMQFPGLLRDLGVHPQAHVAWTLDKGRFERFSGTLSPPSLEGPMEIATHGFEIFDKPTTDPTRGHMMGVAEGSLRGTFMVRDTGIMLSDVTLQTPKSEVRTTVKLLFRSFLDIEIAKGSHIDLSEISPLKNLPLAGVAEIAAAARGPFSRPQVDAEVAIKGFEFASFSFGDVERARAHFEPFDLNLVDVQIRKGESRIRAPEVHVDFDAGPNVVVDADVDTTSAPHLFIHDFYKIVHLDEDPRFADIDGNASGTARVHFVVGGPEDRCGGGRLRVKTRMHLEEASLFGERYTDGDVDVDLDWEDREAGAAGMWLDVHSATLRKGSGSVLASATVRPGGRVTGQAIATGIPIDHLDTLGRMGKPLDGSISLVADLSGTVSQLEAQADVQISPIRIGPDSLPSSNLRFLMSSEGTSPPRTIGWTKCQNPRTAPFDRAEFDRDPSGGTFRVDGKIAGGQIELDDVRITRQRHKVVTGKVTTRKLDLGTLANLIPGVAFSANPPRGELDASLDLRKLPLDDLAKSDVVVTLAGMELEQSGKRVSLAQSSGPIVLQQNTLALPDLALLVQAGSGLSAPIALGGKVSRVVTAPELDVSLRVGPLDLARLSADMPQITRAKGTVDASLRVQGSTSAPRYGGSAHLRGGELALRGLPVSLDDVELDIAVTSREVHIVRGSAKVGGGDVRVAGRMPIRDLELGTAEASITARGVKLPIAEGINLTTDADLSATFKPLASDEEKPEKNLPEVKGTVSLTSFTYSRPIALSLDLNQLAGGPKRTAVETYDPKNDVLRFDINVVSPRPMRFSNNLVDMQLDVTQPGLALSGTNQRYGARGNLRILPDSKLRLRNSEFTVREGTVRFDDPLRFAPKVDVRAQTEYRRYAASSSATNLTDTSSTAAATASLGQQWRINLYAHGDEENLKLDLTSDPPLGQEDIVLLLTLGLTRAEMDRGLASSLGETVGLEALAALTGADKAVKTIVPLIDEFRFGTSYSSRTGRTEPTVTLGKRITEDVRATVTTGITENREIRSSIEWRLGKRVIVQGAYDNTNDVSSSPLGNLGADLRFRLEFE